MEKKKIVVIGGSAAGAKAAAKARRLDQHAKITIIQKDHDLSMASCGFPYYIEGLFDDRNMLLATPAGVTRDAEFFLKTKKIEAFTDTEVVAIDRAAQTVLCRDLSVGDQFSLEYDKLIICTGAQARRLPVPGVDLEGVTHLLSMADTDYLRKIGDYQEVKQAVVIGGGLIGVETSEALIESEISVTVVEMLPQILSFLDTQLAGLVENHMKSKGVQLLTGTKVEALLGREGKLIGVQLADGTVLPCEVAVLATGVQPNVQLAASAGIEIGALGGITVNEYMQTSDENIYAAGDCIEVDNLITGKKVLAPMGDLANLQGRVAGENAAIGNCVSFDGTILTSICKVFEFAAGATGLTEEAAKRQGITNIETVVNASPDKPGFMGAKLLVSKIVVAKDTERILGYQCVGNGDVSRQLATAAMAVKGQMTIAALSCADLPYAPPFSLAIDHFIASAHIVQNKLKGRLKTITAAEVYAKCHGENPPFLLDARGANEYEVSRLGIGEKYIPVGALRDMLDELPQDRSKEIICFCAIALRGYESALILEAHGWHNVKVMEGGIAAWPYSREK